MLNLEELHGTSPRDIILNEEIVSYCLDNLYTFIVSRLNTFCEKTAHNSKAIRELKKIVNGDSTNNIKLYNFINDYSDIGFSYYSSHILFRIDFKKMFECDCTVFEYKLPITIQQKSKLKKINNTCLAGIFNKLSLTPEYEFGKMCEDIKTLNYYTPYIPE